MVLKREDNNHSEELVKPLRPETVDSIAKSLKIDLHI